ncbi:hypothetical protein OH492_09250 [Vibrio chagasii]|nr:hypothetical protein [Vibrio chagasii]
MKRKLMRRSERNVLFRPAPNYPTGNDINQVQVNVSGTITDTATYNDASSPARTATDTDTFSPQC